MVALVMRRFLHKRKRLLMPSSTVGENHPVFYLGHFLGITNNGRELGNATTKRTSPASPRAKASDRIKMNSGRGKQPTDARVYADRLP